MNAARSFPRRAATAHATTSPTPTSSHAPRATASGKPRSSSEVDERVRVVADRVLEPSQEIRIAAEAVEPDHCPRPEEKDDSDPGREHGARKPARRREPHEQRPQQELHGESGPHARGARNESVAQAPCQRRSEREPERHVPGLNRRDHRRPEKEHSVAPPVADSENKRHRQCDSDEREHDEHACRTDRQERQRSEQERRKRWVHPRLAGRREQCVPFRIRVAPRKDVL